jgi:RNA polymerase sigma-70 factor (ECF subfamily)
MAVMNEESQTLSIDPDAELMLRFKAGDLEAFELLFSRHVRPLVNFAYKFVRNRDVAEELAQEIFLRVHDAGPTYRAEAKFTTWLYRIATNVCLNEVRKPSFKAVHESIDAPSEDRPNGNPMEVEDCTQVDPLRQLERLSVSSALKSALEQLPEKQRLAFILNKYQDLSYAEVAQVLRISEKAVKSLIHRAKEAMAARLMPLMSELLS